MMKESSYLLFYFIFVSLFVLNHAANCGPFQNNHNQLFWSSQNLLAFPSSIYVPSSFTFQSLTWNFNSSGILEVKESNGNVVFAFGRAVSCSASNLCTLNFQNDGNLVIYGTTSGATWASNTWGGQGIYVKYQTTPPYLSVVAPDCTTAWPGTSTGQPTISKARTTTVLDANNAAQVSFSSIALSANRWKSQFAVNSHISQGWSSTMVKQLTSYLGVSAIRDSIPSGASGTVQYNDYVAMNNQGIKLNVVAGTTTSITGLQSQVTAWANFHSATGMIQSVEGFNEINNWGFDYNGLDHTKTYVGMFKAQADLYSLVKGNTVLKNLPVYDFTGQCFYPSSDTLDCFNISGRADRTNLHVYFGQGSQFVGLGNSNNNLIGGLNGEYGRKWSSTSNNVITETGWHTDTFANGVTETAAAKLQVNALLELISGGNNKAFIYELIDEVWSGYDGQESHFGLFRNNQTPKPSARALHFLSGLLSDSGAGSSDSLTYYLTNFPYNGKRLLFQKTNKAFVLVLWNNLPVYNPTSNTDISNAAVTVTLTLPWATSISVYDIYSTTADDTLPLTAISTVTSTSATFSIADKAVVISFTAPSSSTPAPTPAPTTKPTTAPTSSPTSCPGQYLIDQNLSVYSTATQPVLRSTNCAYTLSIDPTNGTFQVKYGATVLYTSAVWSVQPGPYSLTMQADGNLVMYSSNGGVWSSGTGKSGYGYTGPGPFAAQLTNSGKFQLIDKSNSFVLWTS